MSAHGLRTSEMSSPVSVSIKDDIATLTMDDGKANALAPAMSAGLNAALDEAEAKGARAVVIRGRLGVLCGGFDLKIIRGDDEVAKAAMRDAGMALLKRLYLLPAPLIIACTGHSVAAGGLLLLTGDTRIGIRGDFTIGLNETRIGLALPITGLELARDRLEETAVTRAVIQAELYDPEGAVAVGYLDQAVDAGAFDIAIADAAEALTALDQAAYAETKRRLRQPTLDRIAAAE